MSVNVEYGGANGFNVIAVKDLSEYSLSLDGAIFSIYHLETRKTTDYINYEGVFEQDTEGLSAIPYDDDIRTLTSLYDDIFERQADLDGLQFYYHEVQNGDSLGTVAIELLASGEYTHKINDDLAFLDFDNEGKVTELYDAFFNRPPDPEGFDYWLGEMNNGVSLYHIADSMIASDEYQGSHFPVNDWDFFV